MRNIQNISKQQTEQYRAEIQADVNRTVYSPQERSRQYQIEHSKTSTERKVLKASKKHYKALKSSVNAFKKTQYEFATAIANARTPNWGSIKVLLIN